MKINYMKRSALLLGAAAIATSGLMAQENWSDVTTKYIANPAYIPGWAGALTATGEGVAEVYNGAFELHQVLNNMPAGEYTLKVDAFYRYAYNDKSAANMADGSHHNAYIFINDAKTTVKGLFDGRTTAPNSMAEAAAAFALDEYVNEVKVNHAGGDLVIGIANTGGENDEWCCFDNFRLSGPQGDVEILNGNFDEGLNSDKNQTVWNCANIDNSNKAPDVNKGGGVYRKTNASPYNIGQSIVLPAGKYRFSVQSFLRHGGAGNLKGQIITCKGAWELLDEESPLDRHENGTEAEEHNAYIYVTNGWDTDDDGNKVKPASEEFALDPDYGNPNGWYKQTAIKCLYDEKLDVYPDNEPATAEVAEGLRGWCDSGFENEAAACFVANPDLYRNYVEFELTEETPLYVGLKKDVNAPKEYWNPWRDIKLEVLSIATGVAEVEDVNAPVEYYNLQGVRVANPTEGIFIVKQGNKATKKVFK